MVRIKKSTTGALGGAIEAAVRNQAASCFLLLCAEALKASYPEPVDLTQIGTADLVAAERRKLIQLLRDEEIVAGPEKLTTLTIKGYRSIQMAIASEPKFAQFLAGEEREVAMSEANELMLALLRVHFQEWKLNKL